MAPHLLIDARVGRALAICLVLAGGCGPSPLPAPCGSPIESADPTLALGAAGATFEYGDEGLPSGLFVRHFDADGTLSWTVPIVRPQPSWQEHFAVAGDTAFVFIELSIDELVIVVRDGAVVFRGNAPFDCSLHAVEARADDIRVYGTNNAINHMCSYRVGRDGSFDSLVTFDADTAYGGHSAPDGGYVINAKEGLVRYDANGVRLWSHAGTFTGDLVFGGVAIWTFRWDDTSATLVRVGLDGQGEDAIAAFGHDAHDLDNSHLVMSLAPTLDGVIAAVEHDYAYTHELVRGSDAGLVWSRALDMLAGSTVAGVAVGAARLIVRGKSLVAFDLDGNVAWSAPRPSDAVIGGDDRVRTADNKKLDACRAVLRVSTLDAAGNAQSTWSAR